MTDNKRDAIAHKSIEHTPTFSPPEYLPYIRSLHGGYGRFHSSSR